MLRASTGPKHLGDAGSGPAGQSAGGLLDDGPQPGRLSPSDLSQMGDDSPRVGRSSYAVFGLARPWHVVLLAWAVFVVVAGLVFSLVSGHATRHASNFSTSVIAWADALSDDGVVDAQPTTYDSAVARVDSKNAPLEFGFDDALTVLNAAGYENLDVRAREALILLREVLRHQAPLLRMAGRDTGFWVTSGATLHKRMVSASGKFNRACLRRDVTLVGCSVASLEARFLQEWVTWHLFVAGFTHLVIYNNVGAGVGADNTPEVLRPFIEAGVVTLKSWSPGVHYDPEVEDAQGSAYHQCTSRLRAVSCRYEHGNPFSPDIHACSARDIAAAAANTGRTLWVAAIDADEFLTMKDPEACATDLLRPFASDPGLVVHWRVYGHSGHMLAPRGELVTEAYTERIPNLVLNQHVKTIANVRFLSEFRAPHLAEYVGGKVAVNEFRVPVGVPIVPNPPPEERQTIFLNHYQPKSMEDGVIKWVRGRASVKGSYGFRIRDPGHLQDYYQSGRSEERVRDEAALSGARMVRAILRPPVALTPVDDDGLAEEGAARLRDRIIRRRQLRGRAVSGDDSGDENEGRDGDAIEERGRRAAAIDESEEPSGAVAVEWEDVA